MRYEIRLTNCAFHARHGALAEEARLGQRFYVDVLLEVDGGDALLTDSIEGTVHYGEVFETIEGSVTGTRRDLIEAVAHDAARAVLDRFARVEAVTITVRKPSVPIVGILDEVSVTLQLDRTT